MSKALSNILQTLFCILLFSAPSYINIYISQTLPAYLSVGSSSHNTADFNKKVFCRPKRPTHPQLYSASYLPHCLLCLLDSLKFILHPNTRTWSMITRTNSWVPQHCNRCPLSTQSWEDMGPGRKQQMKRGGEEKKWKIVIKVSEKQRHGKLQEKRKEEGQRKRDVCQPVSQRCFNTRNNTDWKRGNKKRRKRQEWVKSYQEMRGEKEVHEREEEWDQTRTDEGRQ